MNTRIRRFLKACSLPVRLIARAIRQLIPHNRKQGEICVGICVIFTGAWLADNHPPFIPHFIWEGVVWTVHGLGASPLIESVLHTELGE